jgi:DNA polymerase/3'-5' exonuclease PolX
MLSFSLQKDLPLQIGSVTTVDVNSHQLSTPCHVILNHLLLMIEMDTVLLRRLSQLVGNVTNVISKGRKESVMENGTAIRAIKLQVLDGSAKSNRIQVMYSADIDLASRKVINCCVTYALVLL